MPPDPLHPPEHIPTSDELAYRAFELLQYGVSWVARRKEALTMLDEHTIRRQESIDVDLPALGRPMTSTSDGSPVYYAPMFFLRKMPHQFFNYDLEDESGKSLTLPTRAENGRISAGLLRFAGREALVNARMPLGDTFSGLHVTCDAALESLAQEPQHEDVEDLASAFYTAVSRENGPDFSAALRRDDAFGWMFALLAKSSVVMLRLVGDEPPRRILKLGYDELLVDVADRPIERRTQRLGWDGYLVLVDLPFIGSQNFHFQAEVPEGLQFVSAGLVDRDAEPSGEVRDDVDFGRRVHLYLPGTERNHGALGWLLFRLRGEGFVGGALLAAILVAAALTLFTATAPLIATNATAAPSLLLALTGILASYVGRPGYHVLTGRLLSTARHLLLMSAGLAYVAAAAIAVNPGKTSVWVLRPLWGAMAVAAWFIVVVLWYSRCLPRAPDAPRSRGERIMRWVFAEPVARRLLLNSARVPVPAPDPPTLFARLRPLLSPEGRSRFWLRVKQLARWGDHRPDD